MRYADYEFYKDEYKGTLIPESAFNNLELKASYFIDSITFNRIVESGKLSEEVSYAVCSVAEVIKKIEDDGGIKSSETIGNHSVTYQNNNSSNGTLSENKLKYEAAYPYLVNTGLLYRGVR